METFKLIASMVGTLLLMVAVFAGAYYASKLIGARYQGGTAQRGRIEVAARQTVGRNQTLLVVKAAEKAFLIGVAEKNISMLAELDPEAFPSAPQSSETSVSFVSVLQDVLQNRKGRGEGDDRK
ncbi:MAG: hypothetical protein ABT01_02010 [Clostridium sp. SCN 57-10]|nr:MAG: hypothetical protein ABT01_02010 [Clostridium sp. SCN 57-10]